MLKIWYPLPDFHRDALRQKFLRLSCLDSTKGHLEHRAVVETANDRVAICRLLLFAFRCK